MLAATIESYKTFLSVKYPSHCKLFCNRLDSKPEGARAEAAVFSWLRTQFQDVTIGEDLVAGVKGN